MLILLQLVVPGANNKLQSASTKTDRPSSVLQQPAAADAPVSTEADKRSSVPYMTTASGIRYALSEKVSVKDNHTSSDTTEDQGVCINICVTGSAKTLHISVQILTLFRNLKSHNFQKFKIQNLGIQEVTIIFVKACKICKHGGFLQSWSHMHVLNDAISICT